MSSLTTQDLIVQLNGKLILDGISINIQDGSRTAIIGPNGCGKSTLLKALSGLNRNYQGSIRLDGEDLRGMSRRAISRKLAILPQSPAAPSDMTVKELVAYGRFPYRGLFRGGDNKNDRAVVEEAMHKTKVEAYGGRLLSTLSGGERQRAWIAMALSQQPQILLLDEPTTYLDIAHQLEVMEIVKELNREGMTIVMVLHDINHARMYADDIVILRDRKVFAHGMPTDVLDVAGLASVFGVKAQMYQSCDDPTDKIIFPIELNK